MKIDQRWAIIAYRIYAAVFVISGLGSMFLAHIELSLWFGVHTTPDLVNQYRFIRATEFGFGLLLFSVETEFFLPTRTRSAVLLTFAAIPAARLLSFVEDGVSGFAMIGLALVEILLVVGFLAHGTAPKMGAL